MVLQTRLALLALGLLGGFAHAQVRFEPPPHTPAGVAPSSWWEHHDGDRGKASCDDFTLPSGGTMAEVCWRGGYADGPDSRRAPGLGIGFWPSINGGTQPEATAAPVGRSVRVVSGVKPLGEFTGVVVIDYTMVIDPCIVAGACVKSWNQLDASQGWIRDRGPAWGLGGNGSPFRRVRGALRYDHFPHDLVFMCVGASRRSSATITEHQAPIHAARYRCSGADDCGAASRAEAIPEICFADFNCDGDSGALDVLGFPNAWSAGDAAGEFNDDASANTLDVLASPNAGARAVSAGGTRRRGAGACTPAQSPPGLPGMSRGREGSVC